MPTLLDRLQAVLTLCPNAVGSISLDPGTINATRESLGTDDLRTIVDALSGQTQPSPQVVELQAQVGALGKPAGEPVAWRVSLTDSPAFFTHRPSAEHCAAERRDRKLTPLYEAAPPATLHPGVQRAYDVLEDAVGIDLDSGASIIAAQCELRRALDEAK